MEENDYKLSIKDVPNLDASKLTFEGSLNYIVQAQRWRDDDGILHFSFDNYMPRKNRIYHGEDEDTYEDLIESMKETIERMKIAQRQMQDFIDGKNDFFYYWETDDEPWKNK